MNKKQKLLGGPWVLNADIKEDYCGSSALHPAIQGEITDKDGEHVIASSAFGGIHGKSLAVVEARAKVITLSTELYKLALLGEQLINANSTKTKFYKLRDQYRTLSDSILSQI